MNPPAPRGRGGRCYRPYFYFRRNGRVIPAGRNRPQNGAAPAARPRGWNRPAVVRGGATRNRGGNTAPDCSFLRPDNYVAPDDALKVHSILVENPTACPGWRLYFLRDNYDADGALAKRISAVEAHYQRNIIKYDLESIRELGYFNMPARGIIDDEELKDVWPSLNMDMRTHPLRTLGTLAVAMHKVVSVSALESQLESTAELYVPKAVRTRKIYVRPEEFVPVELITSIRHDRVDSLLAVRGVVSFVDEPIYTLSWQSYRCSRCQTEQSLRQRGQTELRPYNCKQSKCPANDNFIALRSSPYTRLGLRQIIRIEESNLSLLTDYDTTLPGTLDVELRHDLVDSILLGQEIVVTGVLKLREINVDSDLSLAAVTAPRSGDFQAYLKAVSVQDARYVKREFSERDLEAIAMINAEPNSFKLLVQSLAPEIHGHELPKAACLLSLFGGSGSQLNEDSAINVLLVGDPGIGKSKILQQCAQITERGAHICGKRGPQSSKNLSISFSGKNKRTMQGGALLLAHTGHCTVEDVDKLGAKQALLLQSMQTGELNMPLSGCFGIFKAQPSIIACANPQRGQYDQARYLLQNIRIMPSLLQAFHLVYVLLDRPTSMARDVSLTEHVRALHAGAKKRAHIAARYAIKPKLSESMCEGTFLNAIDEDSIMQQDYDLDKHLALNAADIAELDLLPPILIKKFIAYTRQSIKPLLDEKTMDTIKKHFMELRHASEAENEHSQIGVGQLLGLIHLSQARARLDLSSVVTPVHVRDVISILTESMTQTSLSSGRGNYVNAAGASTSKSSQLRSFVHMMKLRSAAICRRMFEFDELKEIGRRAGIMTGIPHLIELANEAGDLLKKGPNIYEVVPDYPN